MKFESFVEQYSNLAYKIAMDMLSSPDDAQDMVQESYLSFYHHFKEYGKLPEKDAKNVLCRIVLNKCKDFLKLNQNHSKELLENVPYTQEDSLDALLKEDVSQIVNAIKMLKEPYSTLFIRYYIDKLSLDEIAFKMHTSKATVKVQLSRGKQKLKEILRKEQIL